MTNTARESPARASEAACAGQASGDTGGARSDRGEILS